MPLAPASAGPTGLHTLLVGELRVPDGKGSGLAWCTACAARSRCWAVTRNLPAACSSPVGLALARIQPCRRSIRKEQDGDSRGNWARIGGSRRGSGGVQVEFGAQ